MLQQQQKQQAFQQLVGQGTQPLAQFLGGSQNGQQDSSQQQQIAQLRNQQMADSEKSFLLQQQMQVQQQAILQQQQQQQQNKGGFQNNSGNPLGNLFPSQQLFQQQAVINAANPQINQAFMNEYQMLQPSLFQNAQQSQLQLQQQQFQQQQLQQQQQQQQQQKQLQQQFQQKLQSEMNAGNSNGLLQQQQQQQSFQLQALQQLQQFQLLQQQQQQQALSDIQQKQFHQQIVNQQQPSKKQDKNLIENEGDSINQDQFTKKSLNKLNDSVLVSERKKSSSIQKDENVAKTHANQIIDLEDSEEEQITEKRQKQPKEQINHKNEVASYQNMNEQIIAKESEIKKQSIYAREGFSIKKKIDFDDSLEDRNKIDEKNKKIGQKAKKEQEIVPIDDDEREDVQKAHEIEEQAEKSYKIKEDPKRKGDKKLKIDDLKKHSASQKSCSNQFCKKTILPFTKINSKRNPEKVHLFCQQCLQYYNKGFYCDYCEQVYENNESCADSKQWVCCEICLKWNHVDCEVEDKHDSKIKKLYKQKDVKYYCNKCELRKNKKTNNLDNPLGKLNTISKKHRTNLLKQQDEYFTELPTDKKKLTPSKRKFNNSSSTQYQSDNEKISVEFKQSKLSADNDLIYDISIPYKKRKNGEKESNESDDTDVLPTKRKYYATYYHPSFNYLQYFINELAFGVKLILNDDNIKTDLENLRCIIDEEFKEKFEEEQKARDEAKKKKEEAEQERMRLIQHKKMLCLQKIKEKINKRDEENDGDKSAVKGEQSNEEREDQDDEEEEDIKDKEEGENKQKRKRRNINNKNNNDESEGVKGNKRTKAVINGDLLNDSNIESEKSNHLNGIKELIEIKNIPDKYNGDIPNANLSLLLNNQINQKIMPLSSLNGVHQNNLEEGQYGESERKLRTRGNITKKSLNQGDKNFSDQNLEEEEEEDKQKSRRDKQNGEINKYDAKGIEVDQEEEHNDQREIGEESNSESEEDIQSSTKQNRSTYNTQRSTRSKAINLQTNNLQLNRFKRKPAKQQIITNTRSGRIISK